MSVKGKALYERIKNEDPAIAQYTGRGAYTGFVDNYNTEGNTDPVGPRPTARFVISPEANGADVHPRWLPPQSSPFWQPRERGDRREGIFREDDDRHLFLKTLAEACAKTDRQAHAWCLVNNHFHLVINGRDFGEKGSFLVAYPIALPVNPVGAGFLGGRGALVGVVVGASMTRPGGGGSGLTELNLIEPSHGPFFRIEFDLNRRMLWSAERRRQKGRRTFPPEASCARFHQDEPFHPPGEDRFSKSDVGHQDVDTRLGTAVGF
jgi:hypothetical protein